MAMIKGQQAVCLVPVSEDDERGVGHADVLIAISVDYCAHLAEINRRYRREFPRSS